LLLERLSAMPGYDVQRGIGMVRGKAGRYLDLLQRFVATHGGDMDLIDAAAASERAEAMRLAHSLKGAAATLGVDGLSEIARRVEFGLRGEPAAPYATLADDLVALRREFQALSEALVQP
jgi:HPt (histidine-containing phosphotransfer) domain-containing protein